MTDESYNQNTPQTASWQTNCKLDVLPGRLLQSSVTFKGKLVSVFQFTGAIQPIVKAFYSMEYIM
ncbi:hypothetical protein J6590_078158 [Homalodisca vitripennis]|nr:hypothetical protein J6590_078158 [Homalodisca vitripennis]